MIQPITLEDLELINDLSSWMYQGNRMISNAFEVEIKQFKRIKQKLKHTASFFERKFNAEYGSFETSVSTGNPIAIGGTRLNRVWAGIFKGAKNKQYAAQISFVMNPKFPCLDVGFYFGRASAHSFNKEQKKLFEKRLRLLGSTLEREIKEDPEIFERFEALFDYGFQAFSDWNKTNSHEWLALVGNKPKNSQIVYRIYANEQGVIETSTISLYVSMIIFLMSLIPSTGYDNPKKIIRPLTAEERAKQAERRTLIGEKGELFVVQKEFERVASFGLEPNDYVVHIARKSSNEGYYVLSCNSDGDEVYIEVKSITRTKKDPQSHRFYISSGELEFYKNHKKQFRLYRVYDIEGEKPEIQIIDMSSVSIKASEYIISCNI